MSQSSHATQKEIHISLYRTEQDMLIGSGKKAVELGAGNDWKLLKSSRLQAEDNIWLAEMGINTRGFLHFTVIQVGGVR